MHSTFIGNSFLLILTLSPLLILSQPHRDSQAQSHHFSRFLSHSHSTLQKRIITKRLPSHPATLIQRASNIYSGPLATVKCLTTYTWALCADVSSCTNMGSVAKGTKCVGDKMIWDGEGDLGFGGIDETVVPEVGTPSVSSVAEVSTKPTESSVIEIPLSKTPTELLQSSTSYLAPPTSTATPLKDDNSNDDDEDCPAEEINTSTDSFTPVVTATTTASVTSTISSWSEEVTSTTTSNSVVLSTITDDSAGVINKLIAIKPKPTPATSASTQGSSEIGPFSGGFATFFTQDGGTGACGKKNLDSAFIVALQIDRYGTKSNSAPDCGRSVKVTNTDNGKTITATVADACPGCKNFNSLDLSTAAFNALANPDKGVIPVVWSFTD